MRRVAGIVLLLVAAAACTPTTGGGGGTPATTPVLANIVVTPDPVAAGSTVTVTWSVTDTSPVAGTTLVLRSTTGTATITGCANTVMRTGGTALDGTYSATCTVPALEPAGTFLVDLGAIDNNGGTAENKATTFTITGTGGDSAPPLVVTNTLGLSSGSSGPVVTATMHVTDQSGVYLLALTLLNPTSHQNVGIGTASLLTGTALDGTFSGAINVIPGTPAGNYSVVLTATDILGNAGTTTLGTIGIGA